MKIGDLVIKTGPFDKGKVGVILEIKENSLGNSFASILLPSGNIVTWYVDLIRIVNESR